MSLGYGLDITLEMGTLINAGYVAQGMAVYL